MPKRRATHNKTLYKKASFAWTLRVLGGTKMPSCAPQKGRRDVVRRFVAATSSSDRIGLRRTVGGGGETSGRRCGRTGTAAAALRATADGPPRARGVWSETKTHL